MFAERFKRLRRERGFTQAETAGRFNVTQQAVAKWEAGRSFPEPALLARIAELFEVSLDYLLGAQSLPPSPFRAVRIIGAVRAGYNALAVEEELGVESADVDDADAYRYLIVKGDSMEPYIHEGDLALVRLQPELRDGDLGVCIYGDGEATLKRFYRRGGSVVLKPFNDNYETLIISGANLCELFIFGKVIETKTRW